MRTLLLLCLAALTGTCFADTVSHRRTAAEVLDLINGPAALRSGVNSALDSVLNNMREAGAPEPAIREFRDAIVAWVENELVWDDIKPQMIDLYVREFSEPELQQLLAFYKTPVGAKALERFPTIFAEGAKIGQVYAQSKQGTLNSRLEQIADRYSVTQATPAKP